MVFTRKHGNFMGYVSFREGRKYSKLSRRCLPRKIWQSALSGVGASDDHSSSSRVVIWSLDVLEAQELLSNQVLTSILTYVRYNYTGCWLLDHDRMRKPSEGYLWKAAVIWCHQEFQVPKMEVLNLISLFLRWVFPYMSLTYSLYRWIFPFLGTFPKCLVNLLVIFACSQGPCSHVRRSDEKDWIQQSYFNLSSDQFTLATPWWIKIHPKKLTWNLEMMVSNRNLLFQNAHVPSMVGMLVPLSSVGSVA